MTGVFIIARLGSTRLARKHLIEAGGKTMIEWLAQRLNYSFRQSIEKGESRIYIVTADREENKRFETVLKSVPEVSVFYGSEHNIPLRQLQCATTHGIENIISIDGDDILCSCYAAQVVSDKLLNGSDIVKTSGLPLGMNVMGYKTEYLRQAVGTHDAGTLETGWGRIFNENDIDEVRLGEYDKDHSLRLTLDYEEDAIFFKSVINELGINTIDVNDQDLINLIREKKLNELNQQVNKQYWENFESQKNKEI